uniref:Uncharacterized protein n=1 Tax=Tetranychus urticae TaxID=32264 RepID=T1L5V9_TETUR
MKPTALQLLMKLELTVERNFDESALKRVKSTSVLTGWCWFCIQRKKNNFEILITQIY